MLAVFVRIISFVSSGSFPIAASTSETMFLYDIRAGVMENFEPFSGNECSAMVRGFFNRLIIQLKRSMFEYWL